MPFLSFLRQKTEDKAPFLERCLSVDLEVDPKKAEIFDLAAVRSGPGPAVVAGKGRLQHSLDRLEAALNTNSYIIGHNILRHDIEHLLAARPRLRDKMMAPIDTLWLNPLAFPRNPYHHLVKHHHDGRLHAGHVNDPELDARLVFDVLSNQIEALKGQSPDLLLAWHHLVTRTDRSDGFDAVLGIAPSTKRNWRAEIASLLKGPNPRNLHCLGCHVRCR
jgi:ATP-dependent DNA helicase RecQ